MGAPVRSQADKTYTSQVTSDLTSGGCGSITDTEQF